MRFRCLLKNRALHYTPTVACRIINSCIVLHNICIEHNIPMPEAEPVNIDFGVIFQQNINENEQIPLRRVNPELPAGRTARQRLINNFFMHNF